jgi:hypothetical protein
MRQTLEDRYSWWRSAAYDGIFGPICDGEPQLGYFQIANGKGLPMPVAVFVDPTCLDEEQNFISDEIVLCHIYTPAGPVSRDPAETWSWIAKTPVTYEAFQAHLEKGQWPTDDGALIGHKLKSPAGAHEDWNSEPIRPMSNFQPANEYAALLDQLEALETSAANLQTIESQQHADQAANIKDRLASVWKALDDLRDAEKRPHDEASRAVQTKYRPLLERAEAGKKRMIAMLTPWLRKLEDAARAAVEAAGGQEASEAISAPRPRAGGQSGRRTGLRTKISVEITDVDALFAALRTNAELLDCMRKLAAARVRAKVETPGIKIIEEKVAT